MKPDFSVASGLLVKCVGFIELARHVVRQGQRDDAEKCLDGIRGLIEYGLDIDAERLAHLPGHAETLRHCKRVAASSNDAALMIAQSIDTAALCKLLETERIAELAVDAFKAEQPVEWIGPLSIRDWCNVLDVSEPTIRHRIKCGELVQRPNPRRNQTYFDSASLPPGAVEQAEERIAKRKLAKETKSKAKSRIA